MSYSAEKIRGRSFPFFTKILASKKVMPHRRKARPSFENLLSDSFKKYRRGTLLCFTKIQVSKNFLGHKEERVEGRITFSCQKYFVPVSKNFEEEAFCVLQKFWYRKNLCRGGNHDPHSRICCLKVPKNIVGEHICVSQSLWCRKTFWITRGSALGGVLRFPVKNLLSHSFFVLANFCYRNFLPQRGISRSSFENLLSHSTQKLSRRTLLCFRKFLVSKSFMDKLEGGSIAIFCRQFVFSQCQTIS